MAVNMLIATPMSSVSAKLCTDGVPYHIRMAHVIAVHMLESKIAVNARLNPASIAALRVFPLRSSSLRRSNIRMLASTAIPMDMIKAATPASDIVAPISLNMAIRKSAYRQRAMSAIAPGSL